MKSKLLIIGFVWPESHSSAAGSRMMQLMELFAGWEITFASTAAESAYTDELGILGIRKQAILLNDESFDTFVAELQPDLVLFDRFMTEEQFGWRVVTHCPDAMRMLDTEDLHCLRAARQKACKSSIQFELRDLLLEEMAKREIASLLRCDLSLIISEFEFGLLQDLFKIDTMLLHYLPLLSEPAAVTPDWKQRKHFIFIGNFYHEPNKDAVVCLKQSIWPLIRKQLPEAELHIYGAYMPQQILEMHDSKSGFLTLGRADEVGVVLDQSRVMLAPLRFGAGIKGKLLEAMQYGLPSVTTTVGAEGMNGNLPWNGFIEDDFEAFAKAAVRLYTDADTWEKAKQNAVMLIQKRYLKTLFEDDFTLKIQSVRNSLKAHRNANFMGNMLQYHTLRSTEYFSRWIEAKNKK